MRGFALPARWRNPPALVRMMWPRLWGYRWRFAMVLLLLPISSLLAMIVPYLTKVAVDDHILPALESVQGGSPAPDLSPLATLMGWAAVVVVLGYLADALYVSLLQRTGQRLLADMRETVYKRTLRLPRSYWDTHPVGTLLTRVTSDIEALGESLASNVLSLVVDLLKTFAYLGMMFYLNWKLTLVLLVLLPVLIVLIRFFQKRVRAVFFHARQALSEATGYLQECLSGIKTLQIYSAESRAISAFTEKNRRFLVAQNRSNYYDALLFSLVEGITTLSLALVLWYAAGELLVGVLSLGVLVAFMEYIQRLFVPVREFSQQAAVIQRGLAALDHINELTQVPLDPAEPEPDSFPAAIPGKSGGEDLLVQGPEPFQSLEFDRVRFRYTPNGVEVLRGISFRLERGHTLALVGATGSGKSTVTRLLNRAYGGYEGSIRINGRELSELTAPELAAWISVVHQGVFLFQGSIAFNIGLERPGMTDGRIRAAAGYVHADSFIGHLPGGFQAQVDQSGANLSAGQAQLIAFARAVAAETEVIVLDEATASVDSMTENLIQQAVGQLYADKTVIAIAHRLSTIRNADTILVMSAGEIIESGDHASLLARGGAYAALVGELDAPPNQAD